MSTSHFFRISQLLILSVLLGACMPSTQGPPGTPPEVPLAPQARRIEKPKTSAVPEGPAEVGAAHILISYKGAMRAAPYINRSQEEAKLLAEELQQKVTSGSDFAKLAEEHSDDPGSAAKGGSLGKFRREQMVPEFSDTAFALDIGQVSDVIESAFGYHVILRTE